MMDNRIKELLELSSRFVSDTLDKGEKRHNLFCILRMETKEVAAHSALIYHLLDKKNFDDDYNLRSFVRLVLGIPISDTDTVSVEREYSRLDLGRIDFVMWVNNRPIAIELKVWAGEQSLQLTRYSKIIQSIGGESCDIFYLTPLGDEPKSGDAKVISFQKELKNWLKDLKGRYQANNQRSKQLYFIITQYIELIDKLTVSYKDDMQKIKWIQSSRDLAAIDELISAKRLYASKVLSMFFGELDTLSLSGAVHLDWEYAKEARDNYYSDKGKKVWYPSTVFRVDLCQKEKNELELKSGHEVFFYIELGYHGELFCGFCIREFWQEPLKIGGNEDYSDGEIKRRLKDVFDYRGNWLTWKWIELGVHKINFATYNQGYCRLIGDGKDRDKMINDTTYLIMDEVDKLKKWIEAYYDGVMERLLKK